MKKVVSAILCIFILCGMTAFADAFPSDWARSEINNDMPQMFESMGIEVDYQRDITRAEFCMLVSNVYKTLNGGLPSVQVQQKFTDVGAETVDMFVPFACSLGIVNGVSDTEFAPRAGLTRQELCTMLCRAFTRLDASAAEGIEAVKDNADIFADSADISDWAKPYIAYCVNKGIIKGTSLTTVAPLNSVSVEQAMVICSRIISEK